MVVFLLAFFQFTRSLKQNSESSSKLKWLLITFAVVHVIHFGLLATNVVVNEIPLEVHKLIGGALAYLMIVIAPFILHRLSLAWQLVYFYYVSFVMIMTYIARIKGDFEGAEPYWLHYVALLAVVGCCLIFGVSIYRSQKNY